MSRRISHKGQSIRSDNGKNVEKNSITDRHTGQRHGKTSGRIKLSITAITKKIRVFGEGSFRNEQNEMVQVTEYS